MCQQKWTLPETTRKLPQKETEKKSSNHPFSDAFAVSFREGVYQFWMKSYPAIWGLFHKPWNRDPIFKPQIDHLTGAKSCCRSISPRKVRPADHRSSHLQVRRAGWDGWAGHPQSGSQGGNRIWMVRTGSWYLVITNVATNHLPCGVLSTFSLLYPSLGTNSYLFPKGALFWVPYRVVSVFDKWQPDFCHAGNHLPSSRKARPFSGEPYSFCIFWWGSVSRPWFFWNPRERIM